MISAAEALKRLQEGNRRFATRVRSKTAGSVEPFDLPQEQAPFAIILGCSDARVPAEIVFDQGPGDLFVIRVAGNVVAPSQLGSVEFAAGQFGTRLVVVLGHSRCGAVQATLRELENRGHEPSKNLRSIVNFIRPAVEPLLESGAQGDELLQQAVRANIGLSAQAMRENSTVLQELIESDGLLIVGAEYSLETGKVHFLDAPAART